MPASPQIPRDGSSRRWYADVTGYQWLVLAIASAGWIFDVYEGQIFNITRNQMLSGIATLSEKDVHWYGDAFLGVFLLGGTVGGLAAGSLADRFGRRPIMLLTILMYSLFSGLTYFATELWQVAALRFLVAMGVGGEWAVAASLVAEVFPARARAQASGIFHASSVLGIWMAALVGLAVGAQWRYAYLVGIAPALLILWVRAKVHEPERWQAQKLAAESSGGAGRLGSFKELFLDRTWRRRVLLGTALGAVGLGTYWGVNVAGQDLAQKMLLRGGASHDVADQQAKFAYGIVETLGNGAGLLAFGPLCAWLGRRRAFMLMQLLAFLVVPLTCFAPQSYLELLLMLPVFGFFTIAMQAGFAIYFPELFPTHLRSTGASFCFNGGRALAAPVLFLSASLKEHMDLRVAISVLGTLYLLGIVIAYFLPETKGRELPA